MLVNSQLLEGANFGHRHKLPPGYRVVNISVLAACIMSIAW
jgi:hypothetical protein